MRTLVKALAPAPLLELCRARGLLAKATAQLWATAEPKARLLPILCDPERVSADVGGSVGAYSYHMRRFSRAVVAVEPFPGLAQRLSRSFMLSRRVRVTDGALSDRSGSIVLRVPVYRGSAVAALATIEPADHLASRAVERVELARHRLDDLDVGPIGFIKIDAEGHELAVLRGGDAVLRSARPTLPIECQDLYRADKIQSACSPLGGYGYGGTFLLEGKLHPIETFDPERDQNLEEADLSRKRLSRVCINNFIFSCELEKLRHRVDRSRLASKQ